MLTTLSIVLITIIIVIDIYQLILFNRTKISMVTNLALILSSLNFLTSLYLNEYGNCILWLIPVGIEYFILSKTYKNKNS
jgi:hypothetical protein